MKRSMLILCALAVLGLAAGPDDSSLILRPDAFKTLVNPPCSHCRDEAKRRVGELRDDDRVLCWIRGYSEGGAIPMRFFLNTYRVISDTYGVFVYDPDAGFARGFAPSLDFEFAGWRNGVMIMKDKKDGTLYSCLTGQAITGPKKGARLKAVATLVSDWGYWLQAYPQAVAYHMFDKYVPVDLPPTANSDALKSRVRSDSRLPDETLVFGIVGEKAARAYRISDLESRGLVYDSLEGKPLVVLWYGPTRTAVAYRPKASPPKTGSAPSRELTLSIERKDSGVAFVDRETGTRWDIAGRGVEGELRNWTLEWLEGVQVRWFAWTAEYPATTLFAKE